MKKTEAKKLIKNYLENVYDIKIVDINNKYNFWIGVNDSIPYEIYVDYQEKSFTVTMLSTVALHESYYYKYDDFGNISRM